MCKLCLESPDLCDSHIIPEFFYRPACDKGGRGRAKELIRDTGRWRYIQKGHRERLLCGDCEDFLNERYEKYVKKLWFDERILPDPLDKELVVLQGIQYPNFKLCMLSILWRAGVARGSMFRQVALGPHEKTLRNMIRNEDPGTESQYAFATQALVMNGRVVFAALMEPVQFRYNGHRVYTFIFGGCSWNFFVGAVAPVPFARLGIRRSGELPVMKQEFTKLDLIRDFVADHLTNPRK